MDILNQAKRTAALAADHALRATGALTRRASEQARMAALARRRSRAQRQLGAVVYALYKNGAQNEALVARYIETLAGIDEEETALLAQSESGAQKVAVCPVCGAPTAAEAAFCPVCGEKL